MRMAVSSTFLCILIDGINMFLSVFFISFLLLIISTGFGKWIYNEELLHNSTLLVDQNETIKLSFKFCSILSLSFLITSVLTSITMIKFYGSDLDFDRFSKRELYTYSYFIFFYFLMLSPIVLFLFSEIADVNFLDIFITFYLSFMIMIIFPSIGCLFGPCAICMVPCFNILAGCATYLFYISIADDPTLEDMGSVGGNISICFGFFLCPIFIPFIPALFPLK